MKARQPPKSEMSRAPLDRLGLDQEALYRSAIRERERADRQRRRHGGDEAAEASGDSAQISSSIAAPVPSPTRSRPGLRRLPPGSA